MKYAGEVIRLHREKLGLSLLQLAKAAGETPSYVSDVEHGRKFATTSMLAVLALTGIKEATKEKEKGNKMTARDFVYWLQGFFEISEADTLSVKQVELIKAHMAMVFIHEIDPAANAKAPGMKEAL